MTKHLRHKFSKLAFVLLSNDVPDTPPLNNDTEIAESLQNMAGQLLYYVVGTYYHAQLNIITQFLLTTMI